MNINCENNTLINLECSWQISAVQTVIEATHYGTRGGASFKNVERSFYDYRTEKYIATHRDYDKTNAKELIKTAEIIDRIYGR